MGNKPISIKQMIKVRKNISNDKKSLESSNKDHERPNCELLLAYYASEASMNKKIKILYEAIFAHEEREINEINLNYMKFDVKSGYHLKIILYFFTGLEILKLSKVYLNSEDLKRLSRGLSVFNKLNTLHLDGNKLDIQGVNIITHLFKSWPRLKSLNLGDNSLGSDCFEVIAKNLHLLTELTDLNLSYNASYDEGAIALNYGIPSCKNLKFLGLASNFITCFGMKNVVLASNNLEKIDFSKNNITPEVAFLFTSKYNKITLIM
jgi:Ran GTPase-activating protein (RanGAP) involved in mRNA processing and transport